MAYDGPPVYDQAAPPRLETNSDKRKEYPLYSWSLSSISQTLWRRWLR